MRWIPYLENIQRKQLCKYCWSFAFSGFDSRRTKTESATSSFPIFPHLTIQVASAGHLFFTKSTSSLLGPLYQMSQNVIVYVYCSPSKYSSWQPEGGLEEWEEGQNVKMQMYWKHEKIFFIWWFIVCYFGISKCSLASSLPRYLWHSIQRVSNYKAPFFRGRVYYFMLHSHFTLVNLHH